MCWPIFGGGGNGGCRAPWAKLCGELGAICAEWGEHRTAFVKGKAVLPFRRGGHVKELRAAQVLPHIPSWASFKIGIWGGGQTPPPPPPHHYIPWEVGSVTGALGREWASSDRGVERQPPPPPPHTGLHGTPPPPAQGIVPPPRYRGCGDDTAQAPHPNGAVKATVAIVLQRLRVRVVSKNITSPCMTVVCGFGMGGFPGGFASE